MNVTVTQLGGVQIVHLDGALVANSVQEFDRIVDGLLARDKREFVVEVESLTGVDSAGLEALTRLQGHCEERLGNVRLAGVNPTLKTIIEITRLSRRLGFSDTTDAAVAEFG